MASSASDGVPAAPATSSPPRWPLTAFTGFTALRDRLSWILRAAIGPPSRPRVLRGVATPPSAPGRCAPALPWPTMAGFAPRSSTPRPVLRCSLHDLDSTVAVACFCREQIRATAAALNGACAAQAAAGRPFSHRHSRVGQLSLALAITRSATLTRPPFRPFPAVGSGVVSAGLPSRGTKSFPWGS